MGALIMEKFKDNQRYSLEEAQQEAMDLKIMIETEDYGSQTYDEAEFYLPEFRLDQAIMLGQAARRAAELDGIYWEDPQCPIIDSEWGLWGEIDMLPESIFDEEDEQALASDFAYC